MKEKVKDNIAIPRKNMKKVAIAYVIGLIVLIYFAYAIIQLIKQPTNVFMIENGSLSEEESAVGYVIRNETVVQGNNYKNGMMKIKTEGERVAKGDSIFRYYSNNEETLVKKIQELDIKIQEAMENETNLFSSDMKLLEKQIEEKLFEIASLNDIQKISEYKEEINLKITKKAKVAGELSPQGSYIRKLIEERSSYENNLNSGAEYITAPESGIVSYRVDGLENVLTPDSFSTLNKKFLNELKLKTGEIVAKSTEKGKIIDNFEGYIVTVLESKKAKEANIGDDVKLRLSNSEEITAKIEYIASEDDSKLIIFKITNGLELLASYRKITFDVIWWSYTGLKVPNDALIKETITDKNTNIENNINEIDKNSNGNIINSSNTKNENIAKDIYYVIRNRMGYTDKMIVKVLRQNDAYSIITNYSREELKNELGYSEEDLKQVKDVVLHDEILINPKI